MVSPDSHATACLRSGRNSTYRPVQISEASSNDLFRLNNVHTDRITIQGWHRQGPWGLEQWVTVRLYGDDVIFEKTFEPPKDGGSELSRQMHKSSPQLFEPRHYTYVEYELHLTTNDQERV